MSRTKGSGWGAGPLLYQICPLCGKKKCIYDPIDSCHGLKAFRCTACKERSESVMLIRQKYAPAEGSKEQAKL